MSQTAKTTALAASATYCRDTLPPQASNALFTAQTFLNGKPGCQSLF